MTSVFCFFPSKCTLSLRSLCFCGQDQSSSGEQKNREWEELHGLTEEIEFRVQGSHDRIAGQNTREEGAAQRTLESSAGDPVT